LRIAVFDYRIKRNNPIGSCHLRLLRALAQEHDFTVFAVEFENPCPAKIAWVRIPAPCRPLALLFVLYHVLAPLYYLMYRLRMGKKFDLIQVVESNLSFGDLVYSHFCHRAYLKHHWKQSHMTGIRGCLRWLDHWLHSVVEGWVYRRAKHVVTPSRGLARELIREFPFVAGKIRVLANAIEIDRLRAPVSFKRTAFRYSLGIAETDTVLVFAALGQFERKGLPLLLQALAQVGEPRLKLIVVGGEPDLIAACRKRVVRMSLEGNVHFTGMQPDPRPYFWAADAFVFPSFYETFSLVTYEAAAAGLPLIVPELNGVEEIIRDGDNGFLVPRSVEGIFSALERFLGLAPQKRIAMGKSAQSSTSPYSEENFVSAWEGVYREWIFGRN
jgi:glycosyltransferase involved in cell wall biosynthesis